MYRIEGADQASPVETQAPAIPNGVRGDALLSLLKDGDYQLHISFANPGGVSGVPASENGEKTGCEEIDLEIAIEPVSGLGSEVGLHCAPGGTDKVPSREDLGTIRVGARFNEPQENADLLSTISGSSGGGFYVHVTEEQSAKGMLVGKYPMDVQQDAILRASVWSDFLLNDVTVDVYNEDGTLALAGARKKSLSSIHSVIRRGKYYMTVWLAQSAFKLLRASTQGEPACTTLLCSLACAIA